MKMAFVAVHILLLILVVTRTGVADVTLTIEETAGNLVILDDWKDIIVVGEPGDIFSEVVFELHQLSIRTTVYSVTSNVRWTPSESVGGLLISSSLNDLAAAVEDLRERNLTGPRYKWIAGLRDNSGDDPVIFRGNDGEKLVLLVPRFSALARTCRSKNAAKENDEAYQAYTLYSNGVGTTCWQLLEDGPVFPSYPNDFGGRSLRITSLGLYPVREPPRDVCSWKWSGYTFDIINYLADFLNFTYTTVQPSSHYYYVVLNNGTVVGVIGDVADRNADMGAGDLSRTPDREQYVDFTSEILDDAVTFVYCRRMEMAGLWTVFAPFSVAVWVSTFASVAIVTLVLGCVQAFRDWIFHQKSPSRPERKLYRFGSITFQALLRQDNATPPLDTVTRIILACWYLACLILCTAYSGRLTAFSVVSLEPALETIDALVRRHPRIKILVKNGSLPFYVIKEPAYEHIWREGHVSVVPAYTPVNDILSRVQREHSAWIGEAAFADFKVRAILKDGNDSNLFVADTSMASSYWSIALQKGSPFLDVFNRKIRRLWYFGLISRLKDIYFKDSNHPSASNTAIPLTLTDMKATFWIWFLGLNVASATFIVEMFAKRVGKVKAGATRRRAKILETQGQGRRIHQRSRINQIKWQL